MRMSDWSSDVCSSDLRSETWWAWQARSGCVPAQREQRRLSTSLSAQVARVHGAPEHCARKVMTLSGHTSCEPKTVRGDVLRSRSARHWTEARARGGARPLSSVTAACGECTKCTTPG